MKIRLASLCMYIMSICFFSWALPTFYDLLFTKTVAKTHMFYSPVQNTMVYTEQILARDLKAEEKSETHHSDVVYKNENNEYFTRNEFEAIIPFIYFRNMEMRGLLPMELHGQSFDRASIEKERRVFEMPARLLDNNMYQEKIYPLLEANPGQVALVLPADRIRFSDTQLEMVDSDLNSVDPKRTEEYTKALTDKGFEFPIQGLWGNFNTFKPYEAGVFILDSKGKTYHLLRENDVPKVALAEFSEKVIPQKIMLAEAKDRKYLGLLLDVDGKMYLMHQEGFKLSYIPTPSFVPSKMDFKLIMDPLFITAVYSDSVNIYANAYNNTQNIGDELVAIHDFQHEMSQSKSTITSDIRGILFPFSIKLDDFHMTKGKLQVVFSSFYVFYGLLLGLVLAAFYFVKFKGQRNANMSAFYLQCASIVVFGIYIFIPLLLMEQYKDRNSA